MDNLLNFTYFLNGILMMGVPILLGFYLTHRFTLDWRLWWIGAATFVISQIGHIPFNRLLTSLFQSDFLPTPDETYRLPMTAILLGLSAAFWEEGIRYAVYRWWAKAARTWRKAILLGSGHGGVEAILLGGLVLFTYFQMVALRAADLTLLFPGDQLSTIQQVVAAYWSAPWLATLLGFIERIFALSIQITLSVMVLQVFTRKRIYWIWLAVGWHALVDAISVFVLGHWGVWVAESAIAILGGISLIILFALRSPEPEIEYIMGTPPAPRTAADLERSEMEFDAEDLERTRYN